MSKVHWCFYDDETPAAIIQFFEKRLQACENGTYKSIGERYRFTYGDRLTGATNAAMSPDAGYVVTAGGSVHRFMLLHNASSVRGPGVMMRNILKIERCSSRREQQRVLYRHPNYHIPTAAELQQQPALGADQRQASRLILRRATSGSDSTKEHETT